MATKCFKIKYGNGSIETVIRDCFAAKQLYTGSRTCYGSVLVSYPALGEWAREIIYDTDVGSIVDAEDLLCELRLGLCSAAACDLDTVRVCG